MIRAGIDVRDQAIRPLVLSEIFPPQHGGSGRWLFEVYRRLVDLDVNVVSDQCAAAELFDRTAPLKISRLPMAMPERGLTRLRALRDYWRLYHQLVRQIAITKPSEIHVGKCLPEGWLAWLLFRRLRIPYLIYVHGEEIEVARTSRELTWMVKQILRSAAAIIANSRNTRDLLLRHWPVQSDRVCVVHPGVDAGLFCPRPGDVDFRRQNGWDGKRVLLTVGRLQQRKGHDRLIEALPVISARIPDVHYAIVGDGEELPRLQSLAELHGVAQRVQFLTSLDDNHLLRCYQNADLFILPNRAVGNDIEGFGMVLVEAQACGCPVIAGDSGGTAETMRVGHSGLIVDCTHPEPLADVVIDLLGGDASRLEAMGHCGRQWVVENLDWAALTEQLRRCFIGNRSASTI